MRRCSVQLGLISLMLAGCGEGWVLEPEGPPSLGVPTTEADAGMAAFVDGGAADAGIADAGETSARDAGSVDARGATARALVADGGRLVDVRTESEYAAGHLEGAANLPVGVLPSRLGELEPKAAWVVVYCRSGSRSAQAARILGDAGFPQVFDLGAMSNW